MLTSINEEDSHSPQRIIQPQMSKVPRSRYPSIEQYRDTVEVKSGLPGPMTEEDLSGK